MALLTNRRVTIEQGDHNDPNTLLSFVGTCDTVLIFRDNNVKKANNTVKNNKDVSTVTYEKDEEKMETDSETSLDYTKPEHGQMTTTTSMGVKSCMPNMAKWLFRRYSRMKMRLTTQGVYPQIFGRRLDLHRATMSLVESQLNVKYEIVPLHQYWPRIQERTSPETFNLMYL